MEEERDDARPIDLNLIMHVILQLAKVRVTDSEPPLMLIEDLHVGLRNDFETYLSSLDRTPLTPGTALASDYFKWAEKYWTPHEYNQVPSVYEEPFILLHTWNLLRYPKMKEFVLIGYDARYDSTRRSTLIQSFDLEKLEVRTASGRLYKLSGRPRREYFLELWAGCERLRELGGETWV